MATAKEDVRALSQEYAKKYDLDPTNLQTALEYAAIHVFAQEPPFCYSVLDGLSTRECDLSAYRCGGSGDLNIDGLLWDDSEHVIVVQTKYRSFGRVDDSDVQDAGEFFKSLDDWLNWAVVEARGNASVKELIEEADLDAESKSFKLCFVTTKVAGTGTKLRDLADSYTTSYEERGMKVECLVFDATDIVKYDKTLREALDVGIVGSLTIDTVRKLTFEFAGPPRVLVTAIKGNTISDIYKRNDVGPKLFNANIRLALESSKVNPGILKTAREEGENFFYYNNGITATCSSYDLTPGGKVEATSLQVVNGAQTVKALSDALKKTPNPDVYVMFRLIETGASYSHKSDLADNITRFQNTQNPVKDSDFYSNEPFQLYLQESLAKALSGKGACTEFYYVRKRGLRPTKTQGKRVGLEELGKLRHSVLYGPVVAFGSPKQLWDSNPLESKYWEAFGRDGEQCEYWTLEELAEVGWMLTTTFKLKDEARNLKKNVELASTETAYLSALSNYVTALTSVGIREIQKEIPTGTAWSEMMATSTQYKRFTDPVLKAARRIVRDKVQELRGKAGDRPSRNFARSDEVWAQMKSKLIEDMAIEGTIDDLR